MKYLPTEVRIALCLVSLTMSILLFAHATEVMPDTHVTTLHGRQALSEELAVVAAEAVRTGDFDFSRSALERAQRGKLGLVSAGVSRVDDTYALQVGPHEEAWRPIAGQPAGLETHFRIPLLRDDELWGALELVFSPVQAAGYFRYLGSPNTVFLAFISVCSFLAYYLFLRVVFRGFAGMQSKAVPRRVRSTLNTMTEGVVILDNDQRIVMANQAFAALMGETLEKIEGELFTKFQWRTTEDTGGMPWDGSIREGSVCVQSVLKIDVKDQLERTVSVNTTPILGDDGVTRGALATFKNLTEVERKNNVLKKTLLKLRQSREEIRQQNQKLLLLATRDPLTGCFNRRAFFELFEVHWTKAQHHAVAVSALLVDVDHFKSVNDTHGHAVGDKVLQHVAELLRREVRASDIVCRYGGEEFCVLLPSTDLEGGRELAERIRLHLADSPYSISVEQSLRITASFGVSSFSQRPKSPADLLDQADKALYGAKHLGRNRVATWPDVKDLSLAPSKKKKVASRQDAEGTFSAAAIPFQAVTALLTALAHRHTDTAEHSRRVADLCVGTARRLLTQSDCYVLEVAALLHDIGKLGVPDAVLLKPGKLSRDEWQIIRTHERIGEEIIGSAFSCPQLTAIISNHHAWYSGNPSDTDLPSGDAIPLGARILAIADAYDAIVSDRVYRKGKTKEEAFAELRRCAPVQFDPTLVERFIEVVLERNQSREAPAIAMNKNAALQIGQQIERLALAMDSGDINTLRAMATQIRETAERGSVEEIATVARRLESAVQSEKEVMNLTNLTLELLGLCRACYDSCLPSNVPSDPTKHGYERYLPALSNTEDDSVKTAAAGKS